MKLEHINSFKYILFILGVIGLPGKTPYVYIFLISIWILSFFYRKNQIKFSSGIEIRWILFFVFYITFTSLFRFYLLEGENIRDFIEAFRFTPILLLFLFNERISAIGRRDIIYAFFIYIFIDFIISFLQFNTMNTMGILDITENLFNRINQLNDSFVLHRTLGLSPNPNEHGQILVLLYLCLLGFIYYETNLKKIVISLIVMIFSWYGIFTSQSRTALSAFLIITFIYFFLMIIYGSLKRKLLAISFFIISFFVLNEIMILLEGYRSYEIFTKGIESNSFLMRKANWEILLFSVMDENLLYFFIGAGKTFFGKNSGAIMDSEYVYILMIYGIFVLFAYLFFLLKIILNLIITKDINNNIYALPAFLVLLEALITGVAMPFFIDVKILCITTIIYIKYKKVKLIISKGAI